MPASLLITGATGHLGRAVVAQLLTGTSAGRIAALTRDAGRAADLAERGVDVRVGSYDDRASLDAAVAGIDTVLLISSGDEGDRLRQHRTVIDAAAAAGVRRLAYTSRSLADPGSLRNALMGEHFETEAMIRESGLAPVIFRNALYMDAVPQFVGGARALESGIFLPAGDGRVAFALRREQGEAIANALLLPDARALYTLTGPAAWSFGDVAEALGAVAGTAVSYTDVSEEAFRAGMAQRGLPEAVVGKVTAFVLDVRAGQEATVTPELADLLGRAPASLADGLREVFGL